MTYNVHAGHAAVGGGAIGAVGILNESIEDRKIKDIVIKYLKQAGHTVYDCTVDNGTANQVLSGIVKKCNAHTVDLDISIHFNAGANRPNADGQTTGTEVWCYNAQSTKAVSAAQRICNNISALGFKNRGVKYSKDLYVLRNTKAQALLVEVCFVDDRDDANLYNAKTEAIGKAIAEGITGSAISAPTSTVSNPAPTQNQTSSFTPYKVKVTIKDLNIRAGASTDTAKKGYIKPGTYTIIEEANGKGASKWGKLKSGAGWVSLDFVKKV